MKNIFLLPLLCLLLASVSTNAQSQQNPLLSPEQQKTVNRFLDQLARERGRYVDQLKEGAGQNMDPILVGKNVIFTKNWLSLLGNGSDQVTRQQFKVYRDKADKIYDGFVDFIGRKPPSGDIIIIDNGTMNTDPLQAKFPGHALPSLNLVFINLEMNIAPKSIRQGVFHSTMAHEIAHIFSLPFGHGALYRDPGTYAWAFDDESIADFLARYARETMTRAKGNDQYYNQALRNFKANKIETFRGNHENNGCAFELYIHGLVDKVGWESYKKAIQSYGDTNFKVNVYEEPKLISSDPVEVRQDVLNRREIIRARDFFDRIAYFHDEARASNDWRVLEKIPVAGRKLTGAQVLRSLPDGGKLLDERFTPIQNVSRTPVIPLPQSEQKGSQVPVTPSPQPTQPTRVWVHPDYAPGGRYYVAPQ